MATTRVRNVMARRKLTIIQDPPRDSSRNVFYTAEHLCSPQEREKTTQFNTLLDSPCNRILHHTFAPLKNQKSRDARRKSTMRRIHTHPWLRFFLSRLYYTYMIQIGARYQSLVQQRTFLLVSKFYLRFNYTVNTLFSYSAYIYIFITYIYLYIHFFLHIFIRIKNSLEMP